jgi:hypothetical protein
MRKRKQSFGDMSPNVTGGTKQKSWKICQYSYPSGQDLAWPLLAMTYFMDFAHHLMLKENTNLKKSSSSLGYNTRLTPTTSSPEIAYQAQLSRSLMVMDLIPGMWCFSTSHYPLTWRDGKSPWSRWFQVWHTIVRRLQSHISIPSEYEEVLHSRAWVRVSVHKLNIKT